MKRRSFLQTIIPLATACGKGITPLEPNQSFKKTLVKYLNTQPYATWTPSEEIIFSQDKDLKLIDKEGLSLYNLKILSDRENENKSISHPNWEDKHIVLQLNMGDIYSEILHRFSWGGITEKLNFDLPQGKYKYPVLSPDANFIVFTFNNEMYISEFPPKGIASKMFLDKKIESAGMYSWSRDREKIAFTAKTQEGTNIYIMDNISSRKIHQLTKGNFHDYNPSFSNDGQLIAFDSNRFSIMNEHYIYTIKSDGSELKKIINESSNYPKFNPNTNELIYSFEKVRDGIGINLMQI